MQVLGNKKNVQETNLQNQKTSLNVLIQCKRMITQAGSDKDNRHRVESQNRYQIHGMETPKIKSAATNREILIKEKSKKKKS